MKYEYYLPPKTAALLIPDGLPQCKNLGLILDKYSPKAAVGEIKDVRESKDKGEWLKELKPTSHIHTELAGQAYTRWENAIKAMQAEHFKAKTDWRMVVGLGGNTVLETDLTLHHLYGIPFIPGSALKGLTRAYARDEKKDEKAIQRIFGTEEQAGNVIFFDAMPEKGLANIDLDMMTPHYHKYYEGEGLPTNTQDPRPVPFLTVKDTTLKFALAPRRPKDVEDTRLAKEWLQTALEKYGVGGKTSAGYGFFIIETPPAIALTITSTTTTASYTRPNDLPSVGQVISNCRVILATDERRSLAPGAQVFLQFREWSPSTVLIVVEAEEAANWTPGQTKNCIFVREEERSGCTLLFCQPIASKQKNKKRKE